MKVTAYIKLLFISGFLFTLAALYSEEGGFKSTLLEFIKKNSVKDETVTGVRTSDDTGKKPYSGESTKFMSPGKSSAESPLYNQSDWSKYVITPGYQLQGRADTPLILYGSDDVNVLTYGTMKLNMTYGKSVFTDEKYRQFDEDKPRSRVIGTGFVPEQELQLHIEGTTGRRMTLYIDHDSRKEDNVYRMNYRAVRDDEIIRNINAGEIDIKFNHSKYAVYDNNSAKGLGLDLTLRKNKLQVKTFGSITLGETEVEYFRGNSSPGNFKMADYQYMKRTYYQLEPLKRYDNLESIPTGSAWYASLNVFTSVPADPVSYSPYSVNINPSGFEIYLDDQDQYNNYNAIRLSIDNGYYTKLSSGEDYTINYTTGVITFKKNLPESSRALVVYTLKSGTSSDPGVILPGDSAHPGGKFSGKNCVFIKYSYSIDEDFDKDLVLDTGEDKNGDGKLNLDIYEIRSYFYLGDRDILPDNFLLQFFNENRVMESGVIALLGKYNVDYAAGLLKFTLREPFRQVLTSRYSASAASIIYTERQPDNAYLDSHFSAHVDYYREARSFKLKHSNIIPDSISIKINESKIKKSLYSIDHTSGFLTFLDPNNPLITGETIVEVKYEYLPLGSESQSFVGGVRGDYSVNRNLNLGGSVLFTRSGSSVTIPDINSSPTQTVVLEGDARLHLGEKKLADLVNIFTDSKKRNVPLEINAYAEYARSYRNINTFGKGLIDNMESIDEIISISLSEKDWILSSMPSGFSQADRGLLYYYFYRSLSSPDKLEGISFQATAVSYSTKPGPFNVATGHVADSITKETSQRSLVFDFDMSGGNNVSVVTRRLSDQAVDFSGLQYVEIWYRYEGTENISFSIDIGSINEDSDGDSILDTEDGNGNSFLDTDPGAGYTEDTGYRFNGNNSTVVGSGPGLNSVTRGDGILNSEDLNGNGTLETTERIFSISPVTLAGNNNVWEKTRVYIDQTALTQGDIDLLKQVEAVRLNISNSTGASGRIYIDNIKFISSRFRNIQMDGSAAGPANLSVTLVNSINDSDYRADAFIFQQSDVYTSLYGEKSSSELSKESESALQLEYSITSGTNVSVKRSFARPLDLRHYKTMNFWFNYRESSGNEIIGIMLGSSENDYVEYRFPMDYMNVWREVKLRLREGSGGEINSSSTTGEPDMKRIRYMRVLIYGNTGDSGKIWLNDIYVSEPETLKSSARWYEGELKIKRPLYKTDSGMPILSDISIKYIHKGHGAQFSTIGKSNTDLEESHNQVFSSFNIFPGMETRLDYTREKTKTDSLNEDVNEEKRGESIKNSFYFITDYKSTTSGIPSIIISYKHDNYNNIIEEDITGYDVDRNRERIVHTPVISIIENIDDFLFGKLSTKLLIDMNFKEVEVKRSSGEIENSMLSGYAPVHEKEKRQKSDATLFVNYTSKYFYVKPELNIKSEELVDTAGRQNLTDTEIVNDVEGGFHFPFIYGESHRFVERNRKVLCAVGLVDGYVTPEYKLDLSYLENRFRDYDESELQSAQEYRRSKDAKSLIQTELSMPVHLGKISSLHFIKNFNLSYMRNIYFFENDIPYEGESKGPYREDYGIKRSLFDNLGTGLNFLKYYPGFFFKGRGNFSNGRSYVYNRDNKEIYFPSGDPVNDYNNQLRLINNFSLNLLMDLNIFVFDSGAGINQVNERQQVNGIPQQIITRNLNAGIDVNLMKIFSSGFFRANRLGIPHHSANLKLGYSFNNNMLITSNIEENTYEPSFGLTFKRDRSLIGFKAGIEMRRKKSREYISTDESSRSDSDDIYIDNMPDNSRLSESDNGYNLSLLYETDVNWLYNLFSYIYRLTSQPIFSLEYDLLLNRYDYRSTVSPEPYDLHMIKGKLTLDLHKNIQGGLTSRWALEKFRNRETEGVSREVLSYEFGMNFTLIF